MIFWDTGALVKCYDSLEPGHARAWNLLVQQGRHLASILLRPEAVSAIVRRTGRDRRLRQSLLSLLRRHLKEFSLIPMDDLQMDLAVELIQRRGLRGADALHLAAALFISRDLGRRKFWFVTADGEQARAARAEGLRVIVPGAMI